MLRTKSFTPLFNKKNFERLLDQSPVDNSFHIRILETLLFPGRPLEILSEEDEIIEIRSVDYYNDQSFYTKKSFIEKGESLPKKALPGLDSLISALKQFPRIPYLLGGNCLETVDMGLSDFECFNHRHKRLYGIDCSGLIYYVTHGNTPRNTKELMSFGKQVSDLKPLDLILFTGHVLIYLGDGLVIESCERDGVVISAWEKRKQKITKEIQFNRFHPQAF